MLLPRGRVSGPAIGSLLLAGIWSAWASAQDAQSSRATEPHAIATHAAVRAYLEPSYLVVPLPISGLDPVWFESQVTAHFFVHRPSWLFAVVLTPEFRVRLFREPSNPVKTPSYVPRVTLFAWSSATVRPREPLAYMSLTVAHHSNGQTGPFFLEDGRINHETGDFYTNYLKVSAYAVQARGDWFTFGKLGIEWHPRFAQKPELHERYGSLRVHLDATVLDRLPLQGRFSARLSIILDEFQRASQSGLIRSLERVPFSVRYALSVPGIELGCFAEYYVGHDDYNIWFDRLLHTVRVGITSARDPIEGSAATGFDAPVPPGEPETQERRIERKKVPAGG